jgi:hypothetical protein
MSQQAKFRKVAFDNSDIFEIIKNIPLEAPSEDPSEDPSKDPAKDPAKTNKPSSNSKKSDLLDNLKDNLFNEDELKELLPYLVAIFKPYDNKFRYSPNAYKKALEGDGNIGYKGTSHSQGAYQKTDPKILNQVKKFKKNPPKNLKDLRTDEPVNLQNINVPNTSDRYKSMRSKLYPKSAESFDTKFIKTSANTEVDEFNKLLPKWDISDVLKSMASVANKTNVPDAEKQQSMMNILSEYEKSIAPLSQFLDKNDIKYK